MIVFPGFCPSHAQKQQRASTFSTLPALPQFPHIPHSYPPGFPSPMSPGNTMRRLRAHQQNPTGYSTADDGCRGIAWMVVVAVWFSRLYWWRRLQLRRLTLPVSRVALLWRRLLVLVVALQSAAWWQDTWSCQKGVCCNSCNFFFPL